MDFFHTLIDFLRNLEPNLRALIESHGAWTYGVLFGIIFAETGLVVTPFLPGDTLLFAAGILANPKPGEAGLNLYVLLLILTIAPICGDNVNYHLGKWLGPRLFKNEKSRFFKRSNLQKTHDFLERHGGKAIILARWVPIVRTFAPFVAGMGAMPYKKFLFNSIIGAFLWVWICVLAGYFFGSTPWVKDRFELAMLALVLISMVPIVCEGVKHKVQRKKKARLAAAEKAAAPEQS